MSVKTEGTETYGTHHLGKFRNNSGGMDTMLLELRYRLLTAVRNPKLRGTETKTLFRMERCCNEGM